MAKKQATTRKPKAAAAPPVNEPMPAHAQTGSDHFVEYSPDHDHARTESALFHRSRKQLIDAGYGCFYADANCDHNHPLEAHHEFLEYSKREAIDPAKFKERHKYVRNPQNGLSVLDAVDWDAIIAGKDSIDDFVDHAANLVIYCKTHHVGKGVGKHHAPDPLVRLTGMGKDGFVFLAPAAD